MNDRSTPGDALHSASPPPAGVSETLALERRLARLRFDLHDGPQQEVHLLAQDLRLFREQLRPMIEDHPDRGRALGRLDDLEAQVLALDADLRRLTTSVRSPLAAASLRDALGEISAAFTARTGIVPRTEIAGETESLTDSQQIALLSLLREALTNVRQHSDAEHVTVVLAAGEDAITIEVSDDGGGFDPALVEPEAARRGHLGLLGMHERMRMLGGHTWIRSTPGGPTTIAATLPRWPVDAGADA